MWEKRPGGGLGCFETKSFSSWWDVNKVSSRFEGCVDCGKSGLEEGWVALGPNPSVLNKMLFKDRHALNAGVACGKSGLEEDRVALGLNPSVLNKMLIKDRHVLKGVWIVGKAAWRRLGCFGAKSFSS